MARTKKGLILLLTLVPLTTNILIWTGNFHHTGKSPGAVKAIYQDQAGVIWVGTTASGVDKFAPHCVPHYSGC